MRATKDSGFEWIGIIPSEWGLSRIADIQAIDSSKYSCDQIALLFARQLIKRLKSE